jgi:hypothetical protein
LEFLDKTGREKYKFEILGKFYKENGSSAISNEDPKDFCQNPKTYDERTRNIYYRYLGLSRNHLEKIARKQDELQKEKAGLGCTAVIIDQEKIPTLAFALQLNPKILNTVFVTSGLLPKLHEALLNIDKKYKAIFNRGCPHETEKIVRWRLGIAPFKTACLTTEKRISLYEYRP